MSQKEAIDLAIEALREAAEKHHFDARYVKMFEGKVPAEVRRGAKRRELLLEAMKVLQEMPSPPAPLPRPRRFCVSQCRCRPGERGSKVHGRMVPLRWRPAASAGTRRRRKRLAPARPSSGCTPIPRWMTRS